MATGKTIAAVEKELRAFALAFPETHEDFPWGERAIKVKKKTFLFMRAGEGELSFSVKLPDSRDFALALDFTEPTHYGLGKSGWVTATFRGKIAFPVGAMKEWVEESYRAIAPKTLVKKLGAS